MAQAFSVVPRNPKYISASNVVTVPAAGTTELLELNIAEIEKLSFQISNATQALDAFVIEGRVHQDASYYTIANAAGDFSAPSGRVLSANGALVTLAAGASGRLDLDVSGLYSVRISASAAVDSAAVSIYASGSTAVTNPNVTLTTGDIEIGAVELKNAATDDRVLVAATGATPTFGVAVLPVVATAAAPTIAEGKIAYLSENLAGALRVAGAVTIASGAVASGAIASGAISAGALVDGADLTQGALGDAAVITDAAGSVSAKLRGLISLWLTHIGTALIPSAAVVTTQRPSVTQVVSTALEASHILKAAAGQLVQLTVFNSKTSSQYILVMNSATLPADGAVTLLFPPIPIGAASILVLDLPAPVVASTGITVCNSSTGSFTKTIGAADCVFYAQVN